MMANVSWCAARSAAAGLWRGKGLGLAVGGVCKQLPLSDAHAERGA